MVHASNHAADPVGSSGDIRRGVTSFISLWQAAAISLSRCVSFTGWFPDTLPELLRCVSVGAAAHTSPDIRAFTSISWNLRSASDASIYFPMLKFVTHM
jgi:hypothetical protein